MNIVKFPNLNIERRKTNDKLRIAYKLIEIMNDEGIDFHIIVERKDADKVFELKDNKGDTFIMTSNLGKAKELKLKNVLYFPIEGNEF